jgi:hypothetical protein
VVIVHVVTVNAPSGIGTTPVTTRPCDFLQAPSPQKRHALWLTATARKAIAINRRHVTAKSS